MKRILAATGRSFGTASAKPQAAPSARLPCSHAAYESKKPPRSELRRLLHSLVDANGLEPLTPTMSTWCSNQLSYASDRSALEATTRIELVWTVLQTVA